MTESTSTTDRELTTSRLIDAPRERVFRAFSDPSHLAQWWGPNGFTNTFEEFDLRPGGHWRFVLAAVVQLGRGARPHRALRGRCERAES